ncbi:hypothetical protein EGM51_12865 [Verrucomicrobia bacterium S94]|nr:hypothetical protein EGM51_12865 [Verrucomicrobia bacterium S94]
MNRLVFSTQLCASVCSVVENQYDLNGNRTSIVYPGGLSVSYNYGADNRLESVATTYSNNTEIISFGYDTANRLTGILYPSGVNSSFGYDAENHMISIKHGNFVDREIHRNALGFKTTECINAGISPTISTTHRSIKTHNDADQLISERVQQGTNWTDIAYGYNDNGGLASIGSPDSDPEFFSYDYNNRLTETTKDTNHTKYVYDASGARIGRVHNSGTNYFVIDYVDGLKRPLAETDAQGNITRYYVWNGSQLLCHIEANGDTYYYHADELGSTLALTDESGAVTDQFAYMPYGTATHIGLTDTPFRWLGGYGVYYDIDTELHLTLHRAYSCSLKRFISPDPLGIDGGVNVYMWANMNPLFFVDPYGLCADSFSLVNGWDYDSLEDWALDTDWTDGYGAWNMANPLSSKFLPTLAVGSIVYGFQELGENMPIAFREGKEQVLKEGGAGGTFAYLAISAVEPVAYFSKGVSESVILSPLGAKVVKGKDVVDATTGYWKLYENILQGDAMSEDVINVIVPTASALLP